MAETNQQLAQIAEVEKKYSSALLKKKHVVGLSIGPVWDENNEAGDFALIVLVDEKVPLETLSPEDRIPTTLDGVKVSVHKVGVIEAI